jgi:Bacterial Ig domain
MRRAALRTAIQIASLGIGVVLMLATESIAASLKVHAAMPPRNVWGYEVRRTVDAKAPQLRNLKTSHVNTIFGDAAVVGVKGVVTARKAAAGAGLPFFQLVHPAGGRTAAVTCASHCLPLAASVRSALASAHADPTRPIAVRLAAPGQVARLASLKRGRVIVFVRLSTITPANEDAWRSALETVKKNPALGIAFSPVGRTSRARVSAVESVLKILKEVIGGTPGFSANHVAATSRGSMSHLTSGTKLGINSRTNYPKKSKLTIASAALANGVCGAFGRTTPIPGTAPRTVVSGKCYRLVLTGKRMSGASASVLTTVEVDTDPPSGGGFVANGLAATSGGSVSYLTAATTLAINSRTDYTDSGSGLAGSVLTIASATLVNGLCGPFGSASPIAGTASQTVASGNCYRLVLTGTDNGGLSASVSTTVEVDTNPPSGGGFAANGVAATSGGSVSYLTAGTTLAINSRTDYTAGGSGLASSVLTIAAATLANNVCGAFGNATPIAGTASQTVVSGNCYRLVLTGTDNDGLTASVLTTVEVDTNPPSGGGFAANGVAATSGGSVSDLTAGTTLAINSRTDYTDSGSGLAGSVLTIASAALANNVCGAFGSASPIAGTASQTVASGNCYLLTLIGTDNVGNSASVSTTVMVDTSAPTTPGLSFGNLSSNAFYSSGSNTLYFRPATGGTYTVTASSSDPETGIKSGNSGYTVSSLSANNFNGSQTAGQTAYTFGSSATQPGSAPTVFSTNNANVNSATATYNLVSDTTAPSGGALSANGIAASSGGSSSYLTSGTTLTINSRTDYAEAQSASQSGLFGSVLTIRSATLTNNTCGSYGSPISISGTTSQTVASGNCYLLTLTGTDKVGNSASVSTTVKVDTDPPAGSITAPGNGNTVSGAISVTASASDTGGSGVASVQFRVDGSDLGSADTTSPYSVSWDTTTATNASHTLDAIVTDNAGKQTTISSITVTVDNSGAITYQRFMSPTGTDSGTCSTAGTACASFWYTYQQASPGDNVKVAAGTYTLANIVTSTAYDSEVLLKYDPTKVGGAPVHFYGQGGTHGTQVDLGSTSTVNNSPDITGAQNVILDNIDFLNGSIGVIPQNASSCGANADGVTLENLYLNGALSVRNAQNLTVKNVDIGNYSLPDGGTQDAWGDSSRIGDYNCPINAANDLLDHVHFHNIYRGDSPSHAECLFVEASTAVTIEGSRFDGCPIMGVFLKNDGGVSGSANYQNNLLIENNFFTQPCPDYTGAAAAGVPIGGGITNGSADDCGSHAIQESDCDNNGTNGTPATPLSWVIRFNSISPSASIWICEPQSDWAATSKLYGNIAGAVVGGAGSPSGCSANAPPASLANWHVAYNVWTDPTAALCSATDQLSTGSAEFQNVGGTLTYDYHLIPGAGPKAHDLVPTSEGCPATDIDGDPRPDGTGFCDAGADEG